MELLGSGLDGHSHFALIQSISRRLSTGNILLDALIGLVLTSALGGVLPSLKHALSMLLRRVQLWAHLRLRLNHHYTRHIEYTRAPHDTARQAPSAARTLSVSTDSEANGILQKAILMYISVQAKYVARFREASYILNRVEHLSEAGEDPSASHGGSDVVHSPRPGCYGFDTYTTGLAQMADKQAKRQRDSMLASLRQFRVDTVPVEGPLVEVDDGLFFRRSSAVSRESGLAGHGGEAAASDAALKVTFTLLAHGPDGRARVDDFVDRAFAYYKACMTRDLDTSRFLYQPVHTRSLPRPHAGRTYKRYRLADAKSFSVLFHPEKERILRHVRRFLDRTGHYGVPGRAHKLGILMHGPPGTGKTSFIKALAAETHRNIIAISLSQVRTNQCLMDMVFDQKYRVEGEDLSVALDYESTVFVFEDIDAATGVVKRRTDAASADTLLPDPGDRPPRPRPGESDHGWGTPSSLPDHAKLEEEADRLNLAGLLNVLDGAVDTPGRIVIMTTNHPEQLDAALIRAGRVDLSVYMGHMRLQEALQMMELNFGEAWSGADTERCRGFFVDGVVTPAELEATCALHDTPADMLTDLECILLRAREAAAAAAQHTEV